MTEINRLNPSDDRAISQFLRIYQSSIEPSEQKTAAQVMALVTDPRYQVLVSRNDDRLTGFAMMFTPSTRHFVLLEYMAVDENVRSHGVGATLLDAASKFAATLNAPLLLEVDQPGTSVSRDNDTARRLRFYAERGCLRIVDLDYILPLETNGKPPPMWLLVRDKIQSLSRNQLREWLTTLYVEVYGKDVSDPRIEAMVSHSGRQSFSLSPIT